MSSHPTGLAQARQLLGCCENRSLAPLGHAAAIYTFSSGRLPSIERGPEPVAQPKTAKPKKKPAAT